LSYSGPAIIAKLALPLVNPAHRRSRGAHSPRADGDWTGVPAETHYGSDGVGVSVVGTQFDERGPFADIQQVQLARRR
jgi:hypothetical protein